MERSKTVILKMDVEQHQALGALARKMGKTKSGMMRHLIDSAVLLRPFKYQLDGKTEVRLVKVDESDTATDVAQ
jgi:hypothetical protein